MRKQFVLRVRVVLGLLLCVAIVLIIRLYFVQIVYGADYREEAENQYVAPAEGITDRGTIFFGDIEAATMRAGYNIAVRPDEVKDPEATYAALNAITPIDRENFVMRVNKAGDPHEVIAARVPKEAGDAILALKLPGVLVERDRWRYYPGGTLGSQVLGFMGFGPNNPDQLAGLYGLERSWDYVLLRNGNSLYVNFFAEIFANVQSLIARNDTAREGDIITSIDPSVQQQLEQTLLQINGKYYARMTGGIVMDPKTGAIIAMGSVPSFDPNRYASASSSAVFRNPLVENEYELGSIMKPITMAAGLDQGVVTPNSTYNDQGFVMKSGFKISNYDLRGRGPGTTMQQVLDQSLNTGVVYVADKLGRQTFSDYLKAFGIGEETGIDLPNEVPGSIAAYQSGSDTDYASASFGQSVAITPIAMTRALAVLANGGVLVQPHVVERIRYATGLVKDTYQPEATRVIKPETAEAISRMLSTVYDDALLGGAVKMERYTIAAKTGTAQMAKAQGGGYYEDRYLHSFFGYFPAYDARFIVFLYTVDPKGEGYASRTLTYPFVDMAKFLINYYDIPPDR